MAGKSYERLASECILRPPGLNDTSIALSPYQQGRLAAGARLRCRSDYKLGLTQAARLRNVAFDCEQRAHVHGGEQFAHQRPPSPEGFSWLTIVVIPP
jgi:CubicO group peptidase (beta-lactamase class C family)